MKWFGTVSAWGALVMAAMFAVNAYFQFATGVTAWTYLAVALGLALGAFRTLRRMSGGLRLLAGAWGIATGLLAMPLAAARASPSLWPPLSIGESVIFLVAISGLVLTVLHKEQK